MRQILIAVGISLMVSILLTPTLIRLFTREGFGQEIREDGPPSHKTKRGTPSMGGLAIIVGVLAGYFMTHLLTWRPLTASGLLILYLMVGLGLVGFRRGVARHGRRARALECPP